MERHNYPPTEKRPRQGIRVAKFKSPRLRRERAIRRVSGPLRRNNNKKKRWAEEGPKNANAGWARATRQLGKAGPGKHSTAETQQVFFKKSPGCTLATKTAPHARARPPTCFKRARPSQVRHPGASPPASRGRTSTLPRKPSSCARAAAYAPSAPGTFPRKPRASLPPARLVLSRAIDAAVALSASQPASQPAAPPSQPPPQNGRR